LLEFIPSDLYSEIGWYCKSPSAWAGSPQLRSKYHLEAVVNTDIVFGLPSGWGCVAVDETGNIYLSNREGFLVFGNDGIFIRLIKVDFYVRGMVFDLDKNLGVSTSREVAIYDVVSWKPKLTFGRLVMSPPWLDDTGHIFTHTVNHIGNYVIVRGFFGREPDTKGIPTRVKIVVWKLEIFTPKGVYLGEVELPGLDDVASLVVDIQGNYYVSDPLSSRIVVFSPLGETIRVIGSEGSGDAQLQNPRGAIVDKNGFVVIADSGNSRIQVFSREGRFLMCIGGNLISPSSPVLDEGGRMMVADIRCHDGQNRRFLKIQIFG